MPKSAEPKQFFCYRKCGARKPKDEFQKLKLFGKTRLICDDCVKKGWS